MIFHLHGRGRVRPHASKLAWTRTKMSSSNLKNIKLGPGQEHQEKYLQISKSGKTNGFGCLLGPIFASGPLLVSVDAGPSVGEGDIAGNPSLLAGDGSSMHHFKRAVSGSSIHEGEWLCRVAAKAHSFS